jgi:hypothetical protein
MYVSVEKILVERDVDAALYLLSRMLNIEFGEKRGELQVMYNHIKGKRSIDPYERTQIVSLYREVIG